MLRKILYCLRVGRICHVSTKSHPMKAFRFHHRHVRVWVLVECICWCVTMREKWFLSLGAIASSPTQNIAYYHQKVRWMIQNSGTHIHFFCLFNSTCVILFVASEIVRCLVCERTNMPIAPWCHQHNNNTCEYWAGERRANESRSRRNGVPFTQNLFCMRKRILNMKSENSLENHSTFRVGCRRAHTNTRARSFRPCGIESHIDSDFRSVGEIIFWRLHETNNNWVFSQEISTQVAQVLAHVRWDVKNSKKFVFYFLLQTRLTEWTLATNAGTTWRLFKTLRRKNIYRKKYETEYAYAKHGSRIRFVDFTNFFSLFLPSQKRNCERCDYVWCVDTKKKHIFNGNRKQMAIPRKFLWVVYFVKTFFRHTWLWTRWK